MGPQRFVFATDGSAGALHAAHWAAQSVFAQRENIHIEIATVKPFAGSFPVGGYIPDAELIDHVFRT